MNQSLLHLHSENQTQTGDAGLMVTTRMNMTSLGTDGSICYGPAIKLLFLALLGTIGSLYGCLGPTQESFYSSPLRQQLVPLVHEEDDGVEPEPQMMTGISSSSPNEAVSPSSSPPNYDRQYQHVL